jgi:hypothetical protein
VMVAGEWVLQAHRPARPSPDAGGFAALMRRLWADQPLA